MILKKKFKSAAAMAKHNMDTVSRVKSVLAQLSTKDFTVLAQYKASKGPDHQIRMGSNWAIYCTGKCWQYSKTGTCKHLEHFKNHCAIQYFNRLEKEK